ncbi:MAG: nucleotidyltransferase domain-containing protein [Candidatus Schekmanbacteria bacterium]|nr:nucleotidyltransferase domain-containing protein [Candidatus Schekmanbacteria bacterium]
MKEDNLLTNNDIEILRCYFASHPEICTAYLFGSQASGSSTELSDIDIAILLKDDTTKNNIFRNEMLLEAEISLLLKKEKIDLLILNAAPLYLTYNVISQGKIVYESDPVVTMDFVEMVITQYLDFAPTLKEYFKEYDASLKQEYLGGKS